MHLMFLSFSGRKVFTRRGRGNRLLSHACLCVWLCACGVLRVLLQFWHQKSSLSKPVWLSPALPLRSNLVLTLINQDAPLKVCPCITCLSCFFFSIFYYPLFQSLCQLMCFSNTPISAYFHCLHLSKFVGILIKLQTV